MRHHIPVYSALKMEADYSSALETLLLSTKLHYVTSLIFTSIIISNFVSGFFVVVVKGTSPYNTLSFQDGDYSH